MEEEILEQHAKEHYSDTKLNEIKIRLYDKDRQCTKEYTLSKLIYTKFKRNKFEYRGMSTGLKDKKGKLIYEGDIVAYNLREGFTDEKFNPRYSVRWSDNYMRFDLMREGKIENIYLEPFFNNKLEIVGNIHQRKTQNVKTEYPPNDIRNFILSE